MSKEDTINRKKSNIATGASAVAGMAVGAGVMHAIVDDNAGEEFVLAENEIPVEVVEVIEEALDTIENQVVDNNNIPTLDVGESVVAEVESEPITFVPTAVMPDSLDLAYVPQQDYINNADVDDFMMA